MTMTSIAVGPASLGTPPPMLTTKRYHLQQDMTPNSSSPTPTKNYETLSKGKKSWSVRLGLSRQHQTSDDATKNWGTISGGSALSRQMLYGEPWLYGTVRSTRGCIEHCNFLTASPTTTTTTTTVLPSQLNGSPILVICSCPEFLSGTTRKLGNCKKCGGHRLARIPLGGTCRIPETSSRIRPSLAGVLRPSVDDPYDLMRRNRLVEPRSRAKSISPHRQTNQRDTRSQSVIRTTIKERKTITDNVSRSEWFDTNINYDISCHNKTRLSTPSSALSMSKNEWTINDQTDDTTTRNTTTNLLKINKKNRSWQQDTSNVSSSGTMINQDNWNDKIIQNNNSINNNNNNNNNNIDSRKSILECNVNPYLLVKKKNQDDDDDLSDDLSDNELEHSVNVSSSLFDPSKVKSIERLPNHSSVAAIGGQRIRVFTEIRELSSDDDNNNNNNNNSNNDLPLTRIPIPKISPKRPPRKQKENKFIIKSILKRGKTDGCNKKNVFFNINNVILTPDKSNGIITSLKKYKNIKNNKDDKNNKLINETNNNNSNNNNNNNNNKIQQDKPKFITIPNIKDLKRIEKIRDNKNHETRIVPDVKIYPKIERKIIIDNNKNNNKIKPPEVPVRNKRINEKIDKDNDDDDDDVNIINNNVNENLIKNINDDNDILMKNEIIRNEDETDLEIEIEELKDQQLPDIGSDEKKILLKANDNNKRSSLTRSQSDRSLEKLDNLSSSIQYLDTMRLSLRRAKDSKNSIKEDDIILPISSEIIIKPIESTTKITTTETTSNELPQEYFRKMRPTSWSPPPPTGKSKHSSSRERTSDPGLFDNKIIISNDTSTNDKNTWCNNDTDNKSKINIISPLVENNNICKITVTPKSSPLIHRLQVGSNDTPKITSKSTSILINGDSTNDNDNIKNNNKVTISVGGENSVCNPTVISVNSTTPPKIKNSIENNRTLVILDNYKSNIVLESSIDDNNINKKLNTDDKKDKDIIIKNNNDYLDNCLTKESMISKLLEDSLKKARENGEILDESSGEAILRILKQSLLKNKQYESSELIIKNDNNNNNYKKLPIDNSNIDFVRKNLFLDENPYEIIKEPIYEEIPDEPPPLPLSPPPIEDFIKDKIYLQNDYKESYYKKVNAGQYLGSYLTNNLFVNNKNSTDIIETNVDNYLTKNSDEFFDQTTSVSLSSSASSSSDGNLTKKFELLNFLMDSKERPVTVEEDELVVDDEEEEEEEEDDDDDDEDDDEDVDDTEGDLEALYEQKETSMGDLSSKSSQISNVSDSSEECNIILTSSTEASKTRTVDIERTDSGVGSESSQASSSSRGVARRWRTGNATISSGPASLLGGIPQVISADAKLCEDCEQRLDPLITDSGVVYAPFVCRKCSKKRAERKEIITEIVETEQKYGRDLRIILEEFHRPMLRAGLLTQEQLSAIFLNVEELLEHNLMLADKLKEAVELSQISGDEDLINVDLGKIFLESERMLHAFESYCTRQGGASLLLQNLEKEKELLRIFLKVSQMENTVLRRMNLNSFLMVPVQRVTKYPLLLARLLKATPSVRSDVQDARKKLEQAQSNIELHLEHMNAEAKDVTSTKLWRRISIIQNGRRSNGEQDIVNIKMRKMAVEILEWAHEEARFVLEGRLLVAQPTDNNWKRGRTVKLAPVTAMLVTNGKSNTEFLDSNDDSLFPRQIGIKEATLLLVKEKIGRYSLLREPLCLDKCIVCCETDLEDYFEIQELSTKETFIFKAEDGARTKRWCRTLQAHAQSLGSWRRRRGALPNIMICGVARS